MDIIMIDTYSDTIEHYGVKGMKWGIRKLKSIKDNVVNNHKENLRYKYRKAGLNESQVESKLKKRIRNEKIALALGGTALAAGGAILLKNGIQHNIIGVKMKKDIKVAPDKVARQTFNDLYKKSKTVRDMVSDAEMNVYKGKSKYDTFNRALVARRAGGHFKESDDTFYNELKKKGYGALVDVNDRKYSGYGAKNPIVLFDTKNIETGKANKLTKNQMIKDYAIDKTKTTAKRLAPYAGAYAGLTTYANYAKNNQTRESDSDYTTKYQKGGTHVISR